MLIVRFSLRFKKNSTKLDRFGIDLSKVKTIVSNLREDKQ
jgi:hypothetical protein